MDNVKSKSEQILAFLLEEIQQGKYSIGKQLPCEINLQEQFNISRTTVRKAYDHLRAKGIVYSVQGKGYFLSKNYIKKLYSDSSEEKKKVGILLPAKISFFEDLYFYLKKELEARNYEHELAFNTSIASEKAFFTKYTKQKNWGIILSPNRNYYDDIYANYNLLYQTNTPFVMIGKPPDIIHCNAVYYDDIEGCIALIRLLYYHQCKQVVHITSHYSEPEAVYARQKGFLLGMKKHFPKNEKIVFNVNSHNFHDKFRSYLQSFEQKIGIVMYDNAEYPKIANIIQEAGRSINYDTLVIGFNSPWYTLNKQNQQNVSSIEYDLYLTSQKAVDLLELSFYNKAKQINDGWNHCILKPLITLNGNDWEERVRTPSENTL